MKVAVLVGVALLVGVEVGVLEGVRVKVGAEGAEFCVCESVTAWRPVVWFSVSGSCELFYSDDPAASGTGVGV